MFKYKTVLNKITYLINRKKFHHSVSICFYNKIILLTFVEIFQEEVGSHSVNYLSTDVTLKK